MTPDEFATQLELLIERARAGGLSDAVIIVGLEEAVEALDEGLAEGSDGGAG
jgi:hypothetical protein